MRAWHDARCARGGASAARPQWRTRGPDRARAHGSRGAAWCLARVQQRRAAAARRGGALVARREALAVRRPASAPAAHRRPLARGTMRMQSTGQGATHSSHPVHSASEHGVHLLAARPTIASTGHGGRHLAQPMQASSSICATSAGPSAPLAGFSGSAARPQQRGQRAMVAAPPGGH